MRTLYICFDSTFNLWVRTACSHSQITIRGWKSEQTVTIFKRIGEDCTTGPKLKWLRGHLFIISIIAEVYLVSDLQTKWHPKKGYMILDHCAALWKSLQYMLLIFSQIGVLWHNVTAKNRTYTWHVENITTQFPRSHTWTTVYTLTPPCNLREWHLVFWWKKILGRDNHNFIQSVQPNRVDPFKHIWCKVMTHFIVVPMRLVKTSAAHSHRNT